MSPPGIVRIPDRLVITYSRGISSKDRHGRTMAAAAAKYAHCQVPAHVEYRERAPFTPSIIAPLEFTRRVQEIYELDRELDRAVLSAQDRQRLIEEDVSGHSHSLGLFDRGADEIARGAGTTTGARTTAPSLPRLLENQLQWAADPARFRPPFTESSVQELHQTLLSGLGLPEPLGEYRTQPYFLARPDGSTVFRACPPERIGAELSALLTWVDRYGPGMVPLVPAALLLHGFFAIRPFPRGNMTVAGALGIRYLEDHGLPNAGMVHLGAVLAEDPSLLVRLLLWTESSGSYGELVDHLTDRTGAAYVAASFRWGPAGVPGGLDEVALRLLGKARRTPGWFSAQEALRWIGGRREQTVNRHLNDLVARGIFESLGLTRAKRYRWIPPFRLPASTPPATRKGPSDSRGGKAAAIPRVAPPAP